MFTVLYYQLIMNLISSIPSDTCAIYDVFAGMSTYQPISLYLCAALLLAMFIVVFNKN